MHGDEKWKHYFSQKISTEDTNWQRSMTEINGNNKSKLDSRGNLGRLNLDNA
jgi:hypothetical protein